MYYDEDGIYAAVANGSVDFVSVTGSLFVCLEAQYGAQALLTIQQPLDQLGGTFFALASRGDLVRGSRQPDGNSATTFTYFHLPGHLHTLLYACKRPLLTARRFTTRPAEYIGRHQGSAP